MNHKKMMFFVGVGIALLILGAAFSQNRWGVPAKASEEKVVASASTKTTPENFLKKDLRTAAATIRKHAGDLSSIEGRAVEERAQAYLALAKGLKGLSNGVEKDTVKSGEEIDRAFTGSYHALDPNHYFTAMENWSGKETAKALRELRTASTDFERWVKETGTQVKPEARLVAEDPRALAGKLGQGAGWARGEVDKRIRTLGAEMEKLGKEV